ncbi:cysteine--tRNA ligase [uncultured Parolsenella sp.]|uniref:cysteine--tRNA ligase n=1 Tax=uncultured Parolsenella sp. TaxID=2083008 RepID=UPI0027DDBF95|nr:cysteine--tRNA ligase [uncultured Parolsenella sp.]
MLVYNSQTHKKQELKPIEPGKIRMYVCGPTVYDQIHVGNGRTFLAFDVIRRYLTYKGYQVTFAQNLTDVDDKIINRANEQGRTPEEVAAEFSDAFIEQMHRLNVLDPDIRPRATREIPAMIEMIQGLIEQGHAYAPGNGDVYFSVRSDPGYGCVSGRNVDELKVGARIEANDEKRDPLDFALWKAAKPGEPMWDSPWGKGRPGWHTECSAMVHRYLGTPIDIHGGGQDLQFPHHENEYAQACCCWHEPLANVWMHTGMLLINGEKMSKSLGNFFTLKEVLDKYPADAVRLLMLQTHYRSPLDFSFDRLDGAVGTLERIRGTVANLRWAAESAPQDGELNDADRALGAEIDKATAEFTRQMDDDFNTAGALAAIFGLVTAANTYLADAGEDTSTAVALRASDALVELLGVLGVESVRPAETALPHELVDLASKEAGYAGDDPEVAADALVAARAEARAAKNWAVADAIRDGIAALGLVVEDTAAGTRIKPAGKEA